MLHFERAVDEDHTRAVGAARAHGESYFERVSTVLADDRSAGLAGAESGETIERCAIPLDLLIEALSNEFAEADTNRIPMTSGRQSAANDSMYCRHRVYPADSHTVTARSSWYACLVRRDPCRGSCNIKRLPFGPASQASAPSNGQALEPLLQRNDLQIQHVH